MRHQLFAVLLAPGLIGSLAFAKAPEAPAIPQTEFKVLPLMAQDFFEQNTADTPAAFAPITQIAQPADAVAMMGGSTIGYAWKQIKGERGTIKFGESKPRTESLQLNVLPRRYLLYFHRKRL
jgi:hypothetical protein